MNKQQESNPSQALNASGRTNINERTTLEDLAKVPSCIGRLFVSSVDEVKIKSRDL